MIQCDKCLTWQHGPCMGFSQESEIPEGVYYCEQCKPEDHVELLRKLAKRQRHSSEKSAQVSQRSRTSRSHSPTQFLKQTKRRNTMNSRDAAYEESIQEILEQSAAEAAPRADTPAKDRAESVAKTEEVYEEIIEIGPGGRKKRKRLDDDMMPTKRKRSASLISEDVGSAITALDKADSAAPITTPLLPPPAPTKSRARRGGRKNAAAQEPSVNGEGEDAGTSTAKKHPNQYTYRGKNANGVSRRAPQSATSQGQQTISTHEHGTRRNASNAANGGSGSGGSSRNNHNAYYNNVQLPMFASWGLPDYLAHLQSILPSEIPPALQIRGATSFLKEETSETTTSGTVENANSQSNARGSMGPPPNEPTDLQAAQMASALASATESVTERGVKVKWPAKRMSVADMNKRVRALVEWVGREQALALDRERRKAALDNALQVHLEKVRLDSTITTTAEAAESAKANGDDVPEEPSAMSVDDTAPTTNEPERDKITTAALPPLESDRLETPRLSFAACLNSSSTTRPSTSKMMEELMEELISFQERFGPSAKGQARDRRVVALA
ncbi:uncharacterized protein FOMMEDRAFT_140728 [Fomitiporia mediterranea MF3/22]|uniref:uncharacterized protein n=1 Tax=Fomitiporia mediterranea (strain MF3/22) TaxID=694068 RepID=UPI0004409415|nr:uncharacterized protein FOMMEDRAFT_140728 [Fomitiporia mediterranea MF3/22]EJD02927.1 hypothetical protein FOMMEDRAFT_140728 [Fomitiporia mediterranea MF3/22]